MLDRMSEATHRPVGMDLEAVFDADRIEAAVRGVASTSRSVTSAPAELPDRLHDRWRKHVRILMARGVHLEHAEAHALYDILEHVRDAGADLPNECLP